MRRRAGWPLVAAVIGLLATGVVIACLLLFGTATGRSALGSSDRWVRLPGGRAYVLHTSPSLGRRPGSATGRPALIVLHGYRDDAAGAERSTGFDVLGDRDGVLIAYPQGFHRSFNAGLCCGDAARDGIDDVGFLAGVVHDLRSRGVGRISVAGFSNGAMMAYRLACERPDLVDRVGVLAGTLEIARCQGPIRALALHGSADRTVPYQGEAYSAQLRCPLRDVRTIAAAAQGSSITLQLIPGLPHRWTMPGDRIDATRTLWEFLEMPAAGPQ